MEKVDHADLCSCASRYFVFFVHSVHLPQFLQFGLLGTVGDCCFDELLEHVLDAVLVNVGQDIKVMWKRGTRTRLETMRTAKARSSPVNARYCARTSKISHSKSDSIEFLKSEGNVVGMSRRK